MRKWHRPKNWRREKVSRTDGSERVVWRTDTSYCSAFFGDVGAGKKPGRAPQRRPGEARTQTHQRVSFLAAVRNVRPVRNLQLLLNSGGGIPPSPRVSVKAS